MHPNTIRAWSDAGRLRYYRINPRGDRRYRLGDLQRFLAAAETGLADGATPPASRPWGGRRSVDPSRGRPVQLADASGRRTAGGRPSRRRAPSARSRCLLVADPADQRLRGCRRGARVPRSTPSAMRTAITSWRPGRPAANGSHPRAVAGADDRIDPPRRSPRSLRDPRQGARTGRRPGPDRSRTDARHPARWPDEGPAGGLPRRPPRAGRGDPRSARAVGRPPCRRRDRRARSVRATSTSPGSRRTRSGRWSAAPSAPTRSPTCSIGPRRFAAWRPTSAAGSTSIGSCPAWSTTRWSCSRAIGPPSSSSIPDGHVTAEVSRGLSAAYLASVRDFPERSLPAAAVGGAPAAVRGRLPKRPARRGRPGGGRPGGLRHPVHGAADRRHASARPAQRLPRPAASLDRRRARHRSGRWRPRRASRSGPRRTSSGWRRGPPSSSRSSSSGTRLSRLSSVAEIGQSIATELRQLIDYHNARVYRLVGDDLIPVAMQGQVGEYVDETPDQLRVAMGEGITGWVAEHRVAQNLGDAAADPRADTIPGTEDDLDESMLLAPMVFDDQVLGVLVLSKLGLNKFTDDDLRLLVIYASFAAQAMANADTTERLREQTLALEQQLRGQRELLQITESILTTLDARGVLESITDRLGRLIVCDNVAIEVVDPSTGLLTPLTARGVHAAYYLEPWEPGETGVATWVVEHNEPVFISDERNDPRVNHFREDGGVDRRQPDRRPAARPRWRDRRPDDRAARPRQHLLGRGVRARPALRGAGLDRAPERRGLPGGRDPGAHRRPHRPAQPRHVPGVARAERPRGHAVQPDHARPRRLPERQQRPRPPGRRRAAAPDRRRASSRPAATRTWSSATAATSSPSCCPTPTRPARSRSPSAHGIAVAATDGTVTASVGVATFPMDGATATRDPAGRRPRLLRRQARRPRPDRDRSRGPGARRRAVAPAADPGRLGDAAGGLTRPSPHLSPDASPWAKCASPRPVGSGVLLIAADPGRRASRSRPTARPPGGQPDADARRRSHAGRADPDPVVRAADPDPAADLLRLHGRHAATASTRSPSSSGRRREASPTGTGRPTRRSTRIRARTGRTTWRRLDAAPDPERRGRPGEPAALPPGGSTAAEPAGARPPPAAIVWRCASPPRTPRGSS